MKDFWKGFACACLLIGGIINIVIAIIRLSDPLSVMSPNEALNSDKYQVDTIYTTVHDVTTVTYKFVPVAE